MKKRFRVAHRPCPSCNLSLLPVQYLTHCFAPLRWNTGLGSQFPESLFGRSERFAFQMAAEINPDQTEGLLIDFLQSLNQQQLTSFNTLAHAQAARAQAAAAQVANGQVANAQAANTRAQAAQAAAQAVAAPIQRSAPAARRAAVAGRSNASMTKRPLNSFMAFRSQFSLTVASPTFNANN